MNHSFQQLLQELISQLHGLADGAASPIISSLKYFRQEYLDHLSAGACPFDPMAATLFDSAGVK